MRRPLSNCRRGCLSRRTGKLFQRTSACDGVRTNSGSLADSTGQLIIRRFSGGRCGRISCSSVNFTCVFNEFESTQIVIDKSLKLNF